LTGWAWVSRDVVWEQLLKKELVTSCPKMPAFDPWPFSVTLSPEACGTDRDHWQRLLTFEERKRGYKDGFRLLFCPWKLIDTADTLFLSLNPGGDPSGKMMRIASDERGNSYLVEREARHSPIADQYRQFCDFIGKNPEEVLTGTLVPFRTASWNAARDRPSISIATPFWKDVLAAGKIRRIFCMGRDVETATVALTGARLTVEVPANWGNLSIRRYAGRGDVQVFGLLHLSTYKMFGRRQCPPQLAEPMGIEAMV